MVNTVNKSTWYNEVPAYLYQNYLIFDCETTTDATQALKFGVFELHGCDQDVLQAAMLSGDVPVDIADNLIRHGLFYVEDVSILSIEEVTLLKKYASEHNMLCIPVQQFIRLLYFYAHNTNQYTCIIGHNLAFDISRLAQEWNFAKKDYINGFSLKLCNCTWQRTKQGTKRYTGDSCRYHPNVKVKKIAPRTHLYEFADKKPRGCFLDTQTFARALLGPGNLSLDALGRVLDVENKKLVDDIVHGEKLSESYLSYAIRDVRTTWQIFQKLRDIYKSYNFSQKMHNIFSEASLGKALYKEMHISPVMPRMNNVPEEYHGYAMTAYYGGRSEVHIRKTPVEVAYCDFKSEYPTVFSLMDLQDMLLAENYEVQDATDITKHRLQYFKFSDLQWAMYWSSLRVLCKISGDNLILPVRAKYNDLSSNIAMCNVAMEKPVWYTLSDVLANILLGGAIPVIHAAIEAVPQGEIKTRPVSLFNSLVTIDAQRDNIFTTLINERSRIRALPEKIEQQERAQLALKLLANSTSYGINIELRTEDSQEPITLYGNDGAMQAASHVAQVPGRYYAPLIGTHIPAGGRLLLAIAQRLAADRGISYAACDTDSMMFVCPGDMDREDFERRVQEIRDWFKPLYPYNDDGELFELEKVNYWQKERDPLYCLAISAKRYVLYNKTENDYRIRKVSAHGLGSYSVSENYSSYGMSPEPEVPLKELGLSPHQRWIYDLWYQYICLAESGLGGSPVMPALATPVYHQVTLSTATLYKQFSQVPGIRPCNFVTVFPGFTRQQMYERLQQYPMWKQEYAKITSAMYVPFTRDIERIAMYYSIATNERVIGIQPLTVEEALYDYFDHTEYKAANGFSTGDMRMRDICVQAWIPQGKESSYEVIELEDQDLPESLSREAIDLEYISVEEWEQLKEQIWNGIGVKELASRLGTYHTKVSRMLNKAVPPDKATLARIKKVLS